MTRRSWSSERLRDRVQRLRRDSPHGCGSRRFAWSDRTALERVEVAYLDECIAHQPSGVSERLERLCDVSLGLFASHAHRAPPSSQAMYVRPLKNLWKDKTSTSTTNRTSTAAT